MSLTVVKVLELMRRLGLYGDRETDEFDFGTHRYEIGAEYTDRNHSSIPPSKYCFPDNENDGPTRSRLPGGNTTATR